VIVAALALKRRPRVLSSARVRKRNAPDVCDRVPRLGTRAAGAASLPARRGLRDGRRERASQRARRSCHRRATKRLSPSVTDYLLVSQTAPRIEHFQRGDGEWRYRVAVAGGRVTLTSGAVLEVDAVFRGVFDLEGE
jgi:hypothetical protein